MRALIVGATSWGCTLAIQLDRAGTEVDVLCRSADEAAELAARREHLRLLPGIALPESLRFGASLDELMASGSTTGAGTSIDAVIFAVPAQRLRENVRAVLPHLPQPMPPIVSASKGLEVGSNRRMSEVIAEELAAQGMRTSVAALSGPNIAREVALEQPSTTVVAGEDAELLERLREMLMTPAFRVYTNPDIVGVELGGALKNIIAIGVGIGDALNAGANGRAAFLTRGLAEMARLGVVLGASPLTFTGLACLGDLIGTTSSRLSRNLALGEALGHGRSLREVLADSVHVVEGVETTRAAVQLAREAGVEMPIVEAMYRVLFEGERATVAIQGLMTREARAELSGLPDSFR